MRRLPWTLYLYVGREIVLYTVFGIVCLILLMMIVGGYRAVNEELSLLIALPYIFGYLGYSLFYIAPVSLLVASTLVYGRFVADREYTALSASGVSPFHLYAPMAGLSLLLTIVAFMTVGHVFPEAHYKKRNVGAYFAKQLRHLGKGQLRTLPIEGGIVYCKEYDGPKLWGVLIEKEIKRISTAGGTPLPEGEEQTTMMAKFTAEEALVDVSEEPEPAVVITLRNVRATIPDFDGGYLYEDQQWLEYMRRITVTGELDVRFPFNEKARRVQDMTSAQLSEYMDTLLPQIEERRARLATLEDPTEVVETEKTIRWLEREQLRVPSELWKRRTLALSMLTMPFLGFPVSITFRYRHRLISFLVGTLLGILILYPFLMLGGALAESGVVPAALAQLSGNLVILTVGTVLSARLFFRG